jgi:cytochrome c-type biogenesis protein CcmE
MSSPPPAAAPIRVGGPDHDDERGLSPLVKVAIVVAMLGGAVSLLWFSTSADDAFVYSKLVNEVMHDPASFRGRELRVEGDLKQGSILFQESPCEWRFVIASADKELPVRFPQCVVPDTFKDGMGLKVTVQGQLTSEGYFHANQVIPRCPSKYEMQERLEAGEKMPHAPGLPPSLAMPDGKS